MEVEYRIIMTEEPEPIRDIYREDISWDINIMIDVDCCLEEWDMVAEYFTHE